MIEETGISQDQDTVVDRPQERSDFNYRFDCKPDFAFLTVDIPEGKTLKAEASSMATMDTNIKMK